MDLDGEIDEFDEESKLPLVGQFGPYEEEDDDFTSISAKYRSSLQ
jgi:hypothetical protein